MCYSRPAHSHTQEINTMPKKKVLAWKTSQKKSKEGKLAVNSDKGHGDGSAWASLVIM